MKSFVGKIREHTRGGWGLFASRDCEAGEIVFVDTHLFLAPTDMKELFLYFTKDIGDLEKKAMKTMHSALEGLTEAQEQEIAMVVPPPPPVDENSNMTELAEAKKQELIYDEFRWFVGILRCNAHGVTLESRKWAIFPDGLRCNHSCNPNVSYRHVQGKLCLIALRPIEADEELLMSYSERLFGSTVFRRQRLIANKHFICECDRCNSPQDPTRKFHCPHCRSKLEDSNDVSQQDNLKKIPMITLNSEGKWTCSGCENNFDDSVLPFAVETTLQNLFLKLDDLFCQPDPTTWLQYLNYLSTTCATVLSSEHWLIAACQFLLGRFFVGLAYGGDTSPQVLANAFRHSEAFIDYVENITPEAINVDVVPWSSSLMRLSLLIGDCHTFIVFAVKYLPRLRCLYGAWDSTVKSYERAVKYLHSITGINPDLEFLRKLAMESQPSNMKMSLTDHFAEQEAKKEQIAEQKRTESNQQEDHQKQLSQQHQQETLQRQPSQHQQQETHQRQPSQNQQQESHQRQYSQEIQQQPTQQQHLENQQRQSYQQRIYSDSKRPESVEEDSNSVDGSSSTSSHSYTSPSFESANARDRLAGVSLPVNKPRTTDVFFHTVKHSRVPANVSARSLRYPTSRPVMHNLSYREEASEVNERVSREMVRKDVVVEPQEAPKEYTTLRTARPGSLDVTSSVQMTPIRTRAVPDSTPRSVYYSREATPLRRNTTISATSSRTNDARQNQVVQNTIKQFIQPAQVIEKAKVQQTQFPTRPTDKPRYIVPTTGTVPRLQTTKPPMPSQGTVPSVPLVSHATSGPLNIQRYRPSINTQASTVRYPNSQFSSSRPVTSQPPVSKHSPFIPGGHQGYANQGAARRVAASQPWTSEDTKPVQHNPAENPIFSRLQMSRTLGSADYVGYLRAGRSVTPLPLRSITPIATRKPVDPSPLRRRTSASPPGFDRSGEFQLQAATSFMESRPVQCFEPPKKKRLA